MSSAYEAAPQTWLNCPGCRYYLGEPRTGAQKCPSCGVVLEESARAADAERQRRRWKWRWILLPSALQFGAILLVLGTCVVNESRSGNFEVPFGGGLLLAGFGLLAFIVGALSVFIEWRDLVDKCGGRRALLLSAACLVAVTLLQFILCDLLSEPLSIDG